MLASIKAAFKGHKHAQLPRVKCKDKELDVKCNWDILKNANSPFVFILKKQKLLYRDFLITMNAQPSCVFCNNVALTCCPPQYSYSWCLRCLSAACLRSFSTAGSAPRG